MLKPTDLLTLMLAECDARGLLTDYRDDLTGADAGTLTEMAGWDRFVWLVGATYSYLYPIGLHPEQHKHATAVIATRGTGFALSPLVCYIVSPKAAKPLREVTKEQVRDILATAACWTLRGREVVAPDGVVKGTADIVYTEDYQRGCSRADVTVVAKRPADQGFMELFTVSQAVSAKGMWTRVFRADETKVAA